MQTQFQAQSNETTTYRPNVDGALAASSEETAEEHARQSQADTWLGIYAGERRKRQRQKQIGIGLASFGIFVAVAVLTIFVAYGLITHNWRTLSWLPAFSGLSGLSGFLSWAYIATPGQKRAARALAQPDIRTKACVGPLAEALEFQDVQVRQDAMAALTELLPQFRASDAKLLNRSQRACLYRAIKGATRGTVLDETNANFLTAVLTALAQIGDTTAIPHVERLLQSVTPPAGAFEERVKSSAEECLLFLRTHADHARSGDGLLRAAEAPTQPETLLRAAHGGEQATQSEQLLRPGSK